VKLENNSKDEKKHQRWRTTVSWRTTVKLEMKNNSSKAEERTSWKTVVKLENNSKAGEG
jgi:hypothetical protein